MTSKLDYLKKYLAQPGGGDDSPKKEKKKKKAKTGTLGSGLMIRDDSEFLPASKSEAKEKRKFELDMMKAKKRGVFDQGKDESDEDMVFVDEKEAAKMSKSVEDENDRSGVAWTMKMQRKPPGTRVKVDIKEESPPRDLSPPRGPCKAPQKQPPKNLPWEDGNDSDLSPPRVDAKGGDDSDMSPPRAGTKPAGKKPAARGEDSDLSPPRAAIKKEEEDPPIKRELDSDADLSPPRAAGGKKRHDSDADLSPPRKARHDSDADLSPPRAKAAKTRHDSDAESDLSPPRKEDEKMSSGHNAGLVRGEDLRKEAQALREKRKKELEEMPDEATGKDAETVYRSRDGLRITREEWAQNQQKKRKKRASDYPEQEIEWGGGVKQKIDVDSERKRLEAVAAEPLARYVPTADYEKELKEEKRWADPMSKFKEVEDKEKEAQQKAKPKCPYKPPPNRYGILAGYRWDGKVRGNNYEEKWFAAKNNRQYQRDKRVADVLALPE